MRVWGGSLRLALPLALLLATGSAMAAGPDARAKARALADHGYSLFEAGKFVEAQSELEQAEALFHAPTLLVAIARCQAATGKLLAARATYQKVADEKLPRLASEAFKEAQRGAPGEIAALDRRIPTLAVEISGAPPGSAARVTVDGVEVADPLKPAVLDPGVHTVVVTREGSAPVSRTVTLVEMARERVVVDLAAPVLVAPPGDPVAPPPSGRPAWFVPAVASFAAGGALLAIGIGTGVSAASSASAIKDRCGGDRCGPGEASNLSSAKAVAGVSTAGFVVGGAALAAGVVLVVWKPGAKGPARMGLRAGPSMIEVVGEL